MIHVGIVDDHPLMRKGLRLVLEAEPDIRVCCEKETAESMLETLEEARPAVVIVDVSLPGMSGIELIPQIHEINPEIKILVVSRHDESLYAERAIRAGARGYLMKMAAGEEVVTAVRRVLGGGIYVSSDINERLLQSMALGQNAFNRSPLNVLSNRELEVFEMTGHGQGTREISERLGLSIKTIESYRARIKTKLNLASAAELMQHAVQWVESDFVRRTA
ncbi:MAG: DNA-binding response regulator [Bacteroidetes bacterium CG12_big_fil_rev_8_21_14_0_65_60_17]|nr:MAG: DNA-binding response regulator [Bacteroidetes bacterium CG12_big_fil_rev_8_21_14_0_65_60_17]